MVDRIKSVRDAECARFEKDDYFHDENVAPEDREVTRRRDERERRWQADHPAEWAAWLRLQPLWCPVVDFARVGVEYGFEEFLREAGVAPSARHRIERKDNLLPYQPGNIRWVGPLAQRDSPYFSAEQAASYLNMSLSTFYKKRKYIERMPGVGKLLFRREALDKFAAAKRHRRGG